MYCGLLTIGTWGHSSPLRHADVLNGWSLWIKSRQKIIIFSHTISFLYYNFFAVFYLLKSKSDQKELLAFFEKKEICIETAKVLLPSSQKKGSARCFFEAVCILLGVVRDYYS